MATQSMTFLNIMYSGLGVHDIILRQYKEFKGERYFGTYWPITGEPILTLLDLDLVQDVMGEQVMRRGIPYMTFSQKRGGG